MYFGSFIFVKILQILLKYYNLIILYLRDSAENGLKEASDKAKINSKTYNKLQTEKFKRVVEQDDKSAENIKKFGNSYSRKSYSERSGDIIKDYKTENLSKDQLIERYNKKHPKKEDNER